MNDLPEEEEEIKSIDLVEGTVEEEESMKIGEEGEEMIIMEEGEGVGGVMKIEDHREEVTEEMIDEVGEEDTVEEEEEGIEVEVEVVEEEEEEGKVLLLKDSQIKEIGGIGPLLQKILSSLVNERDLSLRGMSNLMGLKVSLLNKLNSLVTKFFVLSLSRFKTDENALVPFRYVQLTWTHSTLFTRRIRSLVSPRSERSKPSPLLPSSRIRRRRSRSSNRFIGTSISSFVRRQHHDGSYGRNDCELF